MKYLRVINTNAEYVDNYMHTAITTQLTQPEYTGPTVCLFRNDDMQKTVVGYTGKHILTGDDCPVKFTWKFGYNQNNQPCIIINFSKIDRTNKDVNDCIVCLESNFRNTNGGSTYTKPCANTKQYIKCTSNNRALSVFDKDGLSEYFENQTYIKMENVSTNIDYYIRIIMPPRYMRRRANYYGQGPFAEYIGSIPDSKYVVNINIRPTFRKYNHNNNIYSYRWNEIPVEDYLNVEFMLNDNYNEY